jgi:predicted TIM-barrel fold metal-dependent hydrolase
MVIDSHTHLGDGNDEKDLIASMDKAGIDYSLLLADSATLVYKTTTEDVIKINEQYPRIKAVGCFEYHHVGTEQSDKLINYLKEGKICGVKFYPGYEDFYPCDEKLFPFYEQCQNLGKPVIFHTGLLQEDVPGKLKQSHPLNIDELAQRFPKLKIVMAHFGNPWVIDATMVAWRNKNVYVDLSGYFGETIPKEHIRFFKYDLRILSGWLKGYRKCLFGSDFPIAPQDEYLKVVKSLPMSKEEKELVLWKNAKEIFGLDV